MIFREKVKVFIDIGKEGIEAKGPAVSGRQEHKQGEEKKDKLSSLNWRFAWFKRECHVGPHGLWDKEYFVSRKRVDVQVRCGVNIGGIKKQAAAV